MSEVQIFQNQQFGSVRTIECNGEPWFVAADVCRALGLDQVSNTIKRLDDDEKALISIKGISRGNDSVSIVNEPGLYSLVLGSRKPEARAFKRWVTHEIIPTIRKHGMYATPEMAERMLNDPDVMIRVLQELKTEREQRKTLEQKVEQDKPKVLFSDAVSTAHNSILIGDLAKLIRQNGVEVGQKRLFEMLRQDGYLISRGASRNMPSQRSMEMGLMEIKESTVASPDGHIRVTKTTKITGKGQVYFINRYLKKEEKKDAE